MKLGRRKFLGLGSAALVGLSLKSERKIAGSFVDDSFQIGHLLRDRAAFPAPKRVEKVPVVIVGGGIAGLSAAWRLRKRGFTDFVLLEMNAQPGGNARWGENEITAFPWAAHYVPVPGSKAEYLLELFEDLGVLKNGQWEERYLAFSPQERLFLYGRWQEGIEPAVGLTRKDRDQFQRLENLFSEFRKSGSFTVPLELGFSSNPMLTKLNDKSLLSARVHIINADAFPWVDSNADSFDFIVIDFPDPTNYSLGKLYTTAFYRAVSRHLSAQGFVVVQSTSPMFARDSFWCIAQTLKQAGLQTYPYHVYVPSFGEWGFVLAGTHEYTPPKSLPAGLRFVNVEGLPALFQFPPDMASLPMPANQLNSQVLVRTYENDWKDISH